MKKTFKQFLAATLLLSGALLTGLSGMVRPAYAQGDAPELNTRAVSEEEFNGLLRYGKLMFQCSFHEFAAPMFQSALQYSKDLSASDLGLRILSESAIFLFRTNQVQQGEELQETIRNSLARSKNPEVRCLQFLAIGYGALAKGLLSEAETRFGEAMREAQRTGRVGLQADCLMLKSRVNFNQNRVPSSMAAAQSALKLYLAAGEFLSQSESYQMIAACHQHYNNRGGADTASRRALETVEDISMGPFLEIGKLIEIAPDLIEGHLESQRENQYEKAVYQVLSLLILRKHSLSLGPRAGKVAELKLNEGVLLAYLAYYVNLGGHAIPSSVFLGLSEHAIAQDYSRTARVEHSWISAKCYRRLKAPEYALRNIERADRVLAQINSPMAKIRAGLVEERGLALLQLQRTSEAAAALNDALDRARKSGLSEETERLTEYLAKIRSGNYNVEELTAPTVGKALARRIQERRRLALASEPELFRSPFAADYPSVASAAQSIQGLTLSRPTPIPGGRKWTPEERIRLGQFEKAPPLLLEIIQKEGDSVNRLIQLGKCYYMLRKWPEAADAFERVLKLDPKNVTALDRLPGIRARIKK